jgi:hypothetical protein
MLIGSSSSRARALLLGLARRPADQNFTVLQDPAHADPRRIGRTAAELTRQGVKRRAAIRRNRNFKAFAAHAAKIRFACGLATHRRGDSDLGKSSVYFDHGSR